MIEEIIHLARVFGLGDLQCPHTLHRIFATSVRWKRATLRTFGIPRTSFCPSGMLAECLLSGHAAAPGDEERSPAGRPCRALEFELRANSNSWSYSFWYFGREEGSRLKCKVSTLSPVKAGVIIQMDEKRSCQLLPRFLKGQRSKFPGCWAVCRPCLPERASSTMS